jgi:hypothetical protein
MGIGSQRKNSRQFGDLKMIYSVPLSAARQNTANEKYFQTLTSD